MEGRGRLIAPLSPPSDDLVLLSSDEEETSILPARKPSNSPGKTLLSAPADYSNKKKRAIPLKSPSEVLTFDAFIQSISVEPSQSLTRVQSQSNMQQPKSVLRKTQKVNWKSEKAAALLAAKEEALRREKEKERRREAVCKLQRWYRRWIRRVVHRRQQFISLLCHRYALHSVSTFLHDLSSSLLQHRLRLLSRYEHICAELIQRAWKRYQLRRFYRSVRLRLQELLKAILQGWKTRKIMKSWALQDCKNRVWEEKNERKFACLELIQVFWEEYKAGKWMRQRRIRPVNFLKKRPKIPEIPKKLIEIPEIVKKQESETSISTTRSTSPKPRKPFLRRKSHKIPSQKVDFSKISTKVCCWKQKKLSKIERKEAVLKFLKRNSVEEFVALERLYLCGDLKQKLPIPQSERTKIMLKTTRPSIYSAINAPRVVVGATTLAPPCIQPINMHRPEAKVTLSDSDDCD